MAEVPFGSAAHQYWLKRFYEIPLWLETDYACFVHACWDVDSMAVLKPLLTADNCLTPHALEVTSREFSPAFDALERVLKGVDTFARRLSNGRIKKARSASGYGYAGGWMR